MLCACGSRSGRATTSATETVEASEPRPATVEDTVRLQLGGKLYFNEFDPADSITVIEKGHFLPEGQEPFRYYRFINHNRHSRGHRSFEAAVLDSTYRAFENDEVFRNYYENSLRRRIDSLQTGHIDPAISDFCGYGVYLTEYEENYYLDDDWAWHNTFHISDSLLTPLYMDGPYPQKITEATPQPEGSLSVYYDGNEEPLRFEVLDRAKRIYLLHLSGDRQAVVTPAEAIHNFEIIEYCNSSGDLM